MIAGLAQDASLREPAALRWRLEALDRLEVYLLDGHRQEGGAGAAAAAGLEGRARALCAMLEAANLELYRTIRGEIRGGAGPQSLLQLVSGSVPDGNAASQPSGEGYDYLDALVAGVLAFESPGAEIAGLAADMVAYQPTPARHIFDLIGRLALSDRDMLVDLGSGLGHVSLLVSICTGASSLGIELEAAYVRCARQSARALNLTDVAFIQQDARSADLSGGTVYYLYTPFIGKVLRTVLDSLRREAAGREIRVCTYGPCTQTVADERWLEVVGALETDRPAVFRSRC